MTTYRILAAALIALAACVAETDPVDGEGEPVADLLETQRTIAIDDRVPLPEQAVASLGYFNVTTTGGRVDGTSAVGVVNGRVYDTLEDGHCAYAQLENDIQIVTVAQACGGSVAFNKGGFWRNVRVCRTGTWTCSAWRWIQN